MSLTQLQRTPCRTASRGCSTVLRSTTDQAHENAYAVTQLVNLGLQSKQYSFDLTAASEAGRIFQGMSPSKDGTELDPTEQAPAGVPSTIAVERYEEFSPGLDTELVALIHATADLEMADVVPLYGPVPPSEPTT